jgi:hypothetical protein
MGPIRKAMAKQLVSLSEAVMPLAQRCWGEPGDGRGMAQTPSRFHENFW